MLKQPSRLCSCRQFKVADWRIMFCILHQLIILLIEWKGVFTPCASKAARTGLLPGSSTVVLSQYVVPVPAWPLNLSHFGFFEGISRIVCTSFKKQDSQGCWHCIKSWGVFIFSDTCVLFFQQINNTIQVFKSICKTIINLILSSLNINHTEQTACNSIQLMSTNCSLTLVHELIWWPSGIFNTLWFKDCSQYW